MKFIEIISIFSVALLFNLKVSNGLPAAVKPNTNENNDYCNACNALVSFVDKLSNNNSEHFIDKALVKICTDYFALPGQQTTKLVFAKLCTFMVNDLLEMFKKVNKTTFCKEILSCHSDYFDQNTLVKDDSNFGPSCIVCMTVVTNFKLIISGIPTELKVKQFVKSACHYLGSFGEQCVSLFDKYLDVIFKFIRDSLQPAKICGFIRFCVRAVESKQIEKVANIREIINIFPPQMPFTPIKSAEPVHNEMDDIECLLCKNIVQDLIQALKDNRIEKAIIQAFDKVCSVFPGAKRSQCKNFVEQNTNELIRVLTEDTDPELTCTLLRVCVLQNVWQSINRPNIEREISKNAESQKAVKWQEIDQSIEVEGSNTENDSIDSKIDAPKNSKVCYECETVMHFIQNEIYDYNNEEQIEEFIENQLCSRMKVVITKEACDNFVREYGPQILQIIAQKLFDPSTVCKKELGLCPNTTQTVTTSQIPESEFLIDSTTEKCDLCISFVKQVDTLLENDQFDKEVAETVKKTCQVLPKNKQPECQLMIESYVPYFLQMIGHMNDANQICESIDMCSTPGHVQLLGGYKCTLGPSYWCHTIAHAEACKATHFCKNKVWKAMP